jgi:autoinducer 2 (AI-2) kinase
LWVLESNGGATGESLEWFSGTLYPKAKNPVEMLIAEASESKPGAGGIVSSFGASTFNARDMRFPLGNLTLSHLIASRDPSRRGHLSRAVLEGLAYGIQLNIDQLLGFAGVKPNIIHFAGGMSRSRLVAQILSEVSNYPVEVSVMSEASALGAAICAGVGVGLYPDLVSGSNTMVRERTQYNPQNRHIYKDLFVKWKKLSHAHEDANNLAAGDVLEAVSAESQNMVEVIKPTFRPRILVTAQMDEGSIELLSRYADVVHQDYREEMRILIGPDLVEALRGVNVLVTEIDILDLEVLEASPDLRVVVTCRGNPVNVDIQACTAHGVPVLNTPGRNSEAVADLTVAFMLMLSRKFPASGEYLRQPGGEPGDKGRMGMAYAEFQGSELWGKTVGLVGIGAVGRLVAERLGPFGVRTLVYDPFVSPQKATLAGAELVPLETLLAESDILSLHAPVTAETRGMIGADQFEMMKPGAFLVNTARAALVDETALASALDSGQLGGAALDVFSDEPPGSDDPLLAFPNLIATPHIGGNTFEVSAHQGNIVVEELFKLMHGQRPRHILNPTTLERFTWTGERKTPTADELERLVRQPGPAVSDLEVEEAKSLEPVKTIPTDEMDEEKLPQKASGLLSGIRKLVGGRGEDEQRPTQTSSGEEVEAMQRIIQTFIRLFAEDEAMNAFAEGKDLTMYFVLTDFGLEFYFHFKDGKVLTALGAPEGDPEVTLKMKAETLDGMFTGRINAPRAAMTGKLSFSGDTAKAMSIQRIQKDLTRLYTAAREQEGDPGDLTKVPEEPKTEPTQPVSAPPQVVTSSRAIRMGDERDELLEVLNELYKAGLITSYGGNISVRTASNPEHIWITPTLIFKGNLRPDMMVRIDLEGNPITKTYTASSERFMHCAIMKKRPDIQSVVHSHAPQTNILSLAGLPFLPISTDAAFIGELRRVPFIMPGSKELAREVLDALGDGVAVLLENHGLVTAGSSLRRAADHTLVVERTAMTIISCHRMGVDPPVLPPEILEALEGIGEMMA